MKRPRGLGVKQIGGSQGQCNIELFREKLSEKSTKVHATIPKGSLGHN